MSYTDIYLTRSLPTSIVLRPATTGDRSALIRVSQRDSQPIHEEPLLVAEVDGEIRAARSLVDGRVIADPFHPTARLVEMLEAHAAELSRERERRTVQRSWLQRRPQLAPRSA